MKFVFLKCLSSVALVVAVSACSKSPENGATESAAAPQAVTDSANGGAPAVVPDQLSLVPRAEGISNVKNGGHCSLDLINNIQRKKASSASTESVTLNGWIVDDEGRAPTVAALVLRNSESAFSAPMKTGGQRPDVAAALGKSEAASSGFNLLFGLTGVTPGNYQLEILAGEGPSAAICSLDGELAVK